MTKLSLDPMCVLSAWEKMGGSAFSSDHAHVEDPNAFQLDLSSWEASLRPLSTGSTSPWGTNIFSSLFTPTEMTFACLPGFCPQPSGNGCFPESLQVVPLCFPTPAGSMDSQQNSDVVLVTAAVTDNGAAPEDANQGSQVDEDSRMSLQFSDRALSAPCDSPSSSEAGIVPDFDAPHGSPRKSSGCTATSGSLSQVDSGLQGPTTLATTMQLLPTHLHAPLSPLTSLNFVPVGGGSTTASGRSQEPTSVTLGPLQHSEPTAFSCATSANAPVPAACTTMAAVTAPAERRDSAPQNSLQQPQACLAFSAAAAASVETCHPQPPHEPQSLHYQQQQQAGYKRTRAECLKRYREKKARRLYTKTIRYQLRKINADKRPRIKGRFVKKEELEEFLSASRMMPTDGTAIQGPELEDPYFENQCLLYSDDD